MMGLAQDDWKKGQLLKAIEHSWMAVRLTASDTMNRERAYKYLRQSHDFLQQGKLIDALSTCHAAANLYDEEGATTYQCLQIQQQLYGTPTPFAMPSPD